MPKKVAKPASENASNYGVIYARYSSAGQREESIEGQLRDCHEYADRMGIRIIGEYCDRALSGTNDKRPEFQRMIRDSERGQFATVICWKNDRFARSRYDSAIYKARLKQNGVRILYAKEFIPDSPEGIILESVMEGFAEYYSANLSQNIKRGNYDSALKRQVLGQKLLGYKKGADNRFEIDPETAPIVKRIFEEYASGKASIDIIRDLNRDGHRTSRGAEFTKNSLRTILKNEKYIGIYNIAGVYDEKGVPPLIDEETFRKVQVMIEKHRRSPAAKKVEGGYLLAGKLFCGECGEPMTGDAGTSKTGKVHMYYTCNGRKHHKCNKSRARKEWIEELVVSSLAEIVQDDNFIELVADRFMKWQSNEQQNAELDSLRHRLAINQKATKNSMSLIDAGLITDSLKTHLLELEHERQDIEAGITRIQLESPTIDRASIVWFLRRFRDIDQSDISWRIFIVDTFLQAAYLFDDNKLVFHLNFSGNGNKITLNDIHSATSDGEVLSSILAQSRPPKRAKSNSTIIFWNGLLFAVVQ